jgi:integrase
MQPTATAPRWEVFFYDLDRAWPDFKDPLARCFTDLSAWIRSHDGVSGQPFLLGPNGHPDLRVNAFFGSPRMRALDPDTWRKYGYALGVWLNFLETRRVSWDQATPEDLEAFKVWRLADDRNPARVKAGTFAKGSLAALRAFYGWAAATYKVTSPILTREVQVRGRYGLEPAEQAEVMPSGIREQDVKWLDPAGYRRWRDVGLRGFGLDGLEDPTWRGRNEQRDAAFADGLYETGLRLQEWASVLDPELPADDPTRGYATRWLAAACAKGKVARRYWLPRVALTEVLSYGEGERALAVHRAQRKGRYERLHSVRVVERVYADGRLKLRKAGGEEETVPLDELTPEARLRLFRRVDGELEPLAVWLNEDGLPRQKKAWEKTFERANARLERLGLIGFRAEPHHLRHSFALKWYSVGKLLYEARFAHLDGEELRDFRAQFGDTWQLVALLLGHRDPRTTMGVYLEPFRALDVELLFEHAAGAPIRELLAAVYRDHPQVRTDPLSDSRPVGPALGSVPPAAM